MIPTSQPHRYRCETCKHFYKDSPTRYSLCRKFDQLIDGEDIWFVSRIGCAPHSDAIATEQRIEDVIGELERIESQSTSDDIVSCEYRSGLCVAINLLRNGVEKK